MATIRKIKGSPYWWISITAPNKKRLRFSSKTKDKKLAQSMLSAYEAKVATAHFLQSIKMDDVGFLTTNPQSNNNDEWITKRWSSFNARERQAILFTYYRGRCAYCGIEVIIPERRTKHSEPNRCVIDHRIPKQQAALIILTILLFHAINAIKRKQIEVPMNLFVK